MNRSVLVFIVAFIFLAAPVAADEVEFQLMGNGGIGLLPGNVTPGTTSNGSGDIGLTGIIFNLDTNILHIDIEWGSANGYSDLTGEITNLHLHGPTDDPEPTSFSQTGDLLINLGTSLNFNSSASSGGLVDNFFIANNDVAGLLEGRLYINVHTEMYEFGEIRGYLVRVVPEPGSIGFIVCLVTVLAVRRRR